jgi:hypothetical protein
METFASVLLEQLQLQVPRTVKGFAIRVARIHKGHLALLRAQCERAEAMLNRPDVKDRAIINVIEMVNCFQIAMAPPDVADAAAPLLADRAALPAGVAISAEENVTRFLRFHPVLHGDALTLVVVLGIIDFPFSCNDALHMANDLVVRSVNEPSLLESFVCTQPERAMSLLSQGPAIGLAVDKVAGRAIPAELVPHAFACVDWSAALRHRLLHGQSFAGACRTMRQLLAEMPSDAHPASVFDWLQALLSQPSARCMDLTEEETQAMAGLIVLEQAQEVGGACG